MRRRRLTDAEQWVRSQLECDFQRSVVEAAEALGWTCWHDNDSRRNAAGLPDLICIHPVQKRTLWLELKRETGRRRPAQIAFLTLLAMAGQEAHMVRPSEMDEVIEILKGGNHAS